MLGRLLFCVVLLLAGCSSQPDLQAMDSGVRFDRPVSTQDIQKQLTLSSLSIAKSLRQLAAIEHAIHPYRSIPITDDPYSMGMGQPASIDWTGPVEPIVRQLAKASHYKVVVLGRKPAIPIIVSISKENVPLGTILRDVSFQAQKQADILVKLRLHIIELRYHHF